MVKDFRCNLFLRNNCVGVLEVKASTLREAMKTFIRAMEDYEFDGMTAHEIKAKGGE